MGSEMCIRDSFLDRKIGADAEILMETDDIGRTRDFARVRLAEGAPPGALLHARIEGREKDVLQASRRHRIPGA